jgi:lipoprotein-releasing system ATP-binding protein
MSELLLAEGLRKSFRTGDGSIEVLRGVDLSLRRAERLAVVGASGVGKSTLLHILGTLDRPTAGRLCFKGEDLLRWEPRALAAFRNRSLGFVFQFHHLLPEFDALENVMMPGLIGGRAFAEMRARATRLLHEVGLEHRIRHPVGKLSGGERQRVALARVFLKDAPILILDEATSHLDAVTEAEVLDAIDGWAHDRTVLVIAHLPEPLRLAGRVITLPAR